jgi:hypothetical protein
MEIVLPQTLTILDSRAAILPSLITGLFLAYCYAHFANRNFGSALLYTTAFHAAINVIGWSMIVFAGTA